MRTSFPYQSAIWAACAFLALIVLPLRAETPTQAVDRLWDNFIHLDPKRHENMPRPFWKLSRQVAADQGLAVIPAVMARSKDWKSDEAMIFSALMVSLPRDEAVSVLEKYQKAGKACERDAATAFLTQISDYPRQLDEMAPADRKKFLEETTP